MSRNYNEVMVWERTATGRVLKTYSAPWYFYVRDDGGEYSDIYGGKLSKLEFDNYKDFKDARDSYKYRGEKTYEADISAESKILSELYYNSTDNTEDHISFYDIEVDYDRTQGMANGDNPYAPINAISLFHYWSKKSYMLLVSPHLSKWNPGPKWTIDDLSDETKSLADIKFFNSEKELLREFFNLIEDTDYLVGWNSAGFDTPYVYERCIRLFGESGKHMLGFPNAREPAYKEVTGKFGAVDKTLDVYGREHVDYMKLFQKFEMEMRPSYALESISEEILPELPKLEYEGSLYTLYREDFEHFARYGIRDSECLEGFENKLGYVRLAIQLAHGSTAQFKYVMGTLKIVENAIINFCHYDDDVKVPDKEYNIEFSDEKFTGAAVLKPRVGMHENVVSVDINSLYPSAIRTINASPETIVGQFFDNHSSYREIINETDSEIFFKNELGEVFSKTAKEWKEWIWDNDYTLSAYGTVFNNEKEGILPAILRRWYTLRKEYQTKKKEYSAKMDNCKVDSEEYIKFKIKYEYYDRLQYVYKILLNASYGSLGDKFFKFFDLRLAESTTRTGREILFHMIAKVSELLDGEYKFPEHKIVMDPTTKKMKDEFYPTSESIVYGDTDSCYALTHATDVDMAKNIGYALENKLNESFKLFTKPAFNSSYDVVQCGLDLVSPKSIFLKPKYYIMHLSHFDGKDCDKMKVMGLQIKTTKIPKPVGKKLTKFVERLLKNDTWRTIQEEIVEYKETILRADNPMDIGLPKGVKGFEEYYSRWKSNDPTLKLPGHIAASIFYNECLEKYGDLESPKIVSGSRLKLFYLKRTFGRFKCIAIPTDLKKFPSWFETHFVPLIDGDAQGIRLIDKPLEGILKAIGERIPSRKTLLYDDLVEY